MSAAPVAGHERLLWRGHPSWWDHVLLFVMMAAAVLRALFAIRAEDYLTSGLYAGAIAVFLAIAGAFHYAVQYEITSRRIRIISAMGRPVQDISFDAIHSIKVRRELLNRFFDVGALEIVPISSPVIVLRGIPP